MGHVSPEALAGGPVGKLRDGDMIEIVVDRNTLDGTVNLVGESNVAAGWLRVSEAWLMHRYAAVGEARWRRRRGIAKVQRNWALRAA